MTKFSLFLLLSEQRYKRVLLRNVLVTIYISKFVFFCFCSQFFLFSFSHPQVSSPRFADTSFAIRVFELFTLPANLKLNTQRRQGPTTFYRHPKVYVTIYFLPRSYVFVLKLRESLLKSLRKILKKIVKSILRCRKTINSPKNCF